MTNITSGQKFGTELLIKISDMSLLLHALHRGVEFALLNAMDQDVEKKLSKFASITTVSKSMMLSPT